MWTKQGLNDMDVTAWYGFFAPKNTDRAIIDALNGKLRALISSPEFRQKLIDKGANTLVTTPKEMDALIDAESARMTGILKLNKIQIEQIRCPLVGGLQAPGKALSTNQHGIGHTTGSLAGTVRPQPL